MRDVSLAPCVPVEYRALPRYWFRARRFLAQKVLHTDDTPHAIALGTAIATLVAFLPLIGIQTVLAIGLAAVFRANKAVCIPIVWITNPLSLVPIYGACFGLGRLIMSSSDGADIALVISDIERHGEVGLFELAFWKELFYRIGGLGVELWVGCLVVGIVAGIASYFAARWGVSTYRERRRQRLLKRELLRSKLRPGKVTRRAKTI